MADNLLISRFSVRSGGGSPKLPTPATGAPLDGQAAPHLSQNGRTMPTIVTWAFAPDWLTPAQAAQLLGQAYTEASILALIDEAAIVAEEDPAGAGWLVEKRGLREFQEALWEVLSHDPE